MEPEDFIKWVKKNKSINLSYFYEEYKKSIIITLEDLLLFMCDLHNVKYHELKVLPIIPKRKKGFNKKQIPFKKGKNDLANIRGHLVKYFLENKHIYNVTSKNVYYKLFNGYRDHSTALWALNKEFIGEEQKKYSQLVHFLKDRKLIWT